MIFCALHAADCAVAAHMLVCFVRCTSTECLHCVKGDAAVSHWMGY